MFPYYHPTSVIIVDDDASFLESFQFYFGDRFPCRTFQRGADALAHLRSPEVTRWFTQDFLAPARGPFDPAGFERGDRMVQVRTSLVATVFADPNRFANPSVVVVDYAMPGMSGIEFLQHSSDLPIRKLLLTGKGDEKTAVKAFNQGIVDAFFMKQQPDLAETLACRISELQALYFGGATRLLKSALALEMTDFIGDHAFGRMFDAVLAQTGATEYCLLTEPQGVLMVAASGKASFMLVQDEDHMRAAAEIAQAEIAPPELAELLHRGDIVSQFPSRTGFYEPQFAGHWRRFVWPGTLIEGARRWWYAVIEDPLAFRFAGDGVRSYDDYLGSRQG